jgi:hypothetical protein
MLERNGGVLVCMPLIPNGILPVGPRAITSIGPGTEVLVIRFLAGDYGIILGGYPSPLTDGTLSLSDFIHQTSRCGLRVDQTHSAPFGTAAHGGIADFSCGRPFDGMSLGEWGAITETGLRQFLDPFMVQCAVDEATGVFAFYHDQLLRLAGYNTQAFSGGHESEIYIDEREVHHYDGFTPYPWEQCGSVDPTVDPYRDVDPQDVQFNTPHYAAVEPAKDDQMAFHRSLLFRGYLGQGGKRMVQAPPPSGPNAYSSDPGKHVALWEENLGLDGRYSMRSAKAVHIVKYPAIPQVKRMVRAENANGDNEANYKFAGLTGAGEAHKVTGEIQASDQYPPHLQQAAGLMDVHAWVFNWLGAHPFHFHQYDWAIKEESETFIGQGQAPISFGDLATQFYLYQPKPVVQTVDHRYKGVKYYPNQSYLSMFDDGGVVLGDGYGAEIRMSGGHIFLTAPGDVWVKSGRNFNVLAGHDTCIRAKNSMDLSVTTHDLRLMAQRNLHMLGGNDGNTGGVLIECKAPSNYGYQNVVGEAVAMGGFQVKVAHGDAVVWAKNIYLRTGGGDVDPGFIVVDAAAGQQTITFQASAIANFVSQTITDNFGTNGNIKAFNLWSATDNMIGASLSVEGVGLFQNSILVRGNIECVAGYFGSEMAPAFDYMVGGMGGQGLFLAYQTLNQDQTNVATIDSALESYWQTLFPNGLYADQQAGNDDTIKSVHFTFRNPQQYRTGNFQLFEDRWQQLARLAGQTLTQWTEVSVNGNAPEETMPFPGKRPWRDNSTYIQMDLALFDPSTGASIPRTRTPAKYDANGNPISPRVTEGLYAQPQFEIPKPQPPDGNYMVIV